MSNSAPPATLEPTLAPWQKRPQNETKANMSKAAKAANAKRKLTKATAANHGNKS